MIKYFVQDYEGIDDARPLKEEKSYHGHNDLTAGDAAEEFMNDSGSDMNDPGLWPVTVVLVGEGEGSKPSKWGPISTWNVDMEYSPVFYATEAE